MLRGIFMRPGDRFLPHIHPGLITVQMGHSHFMGKEYPACTGYYNTHEGLVVGVTFWAVSSALIQLPRVQQLRLHSLYGFRISLEEPLYRICSGEKGYHAVKDFSCVAFRSGMIHSRCRGSIICQTPEMASSVYTLLCRGCNDLLCC
jgi:hypothetical protein